MKNRQHIFVEDAEYLHTVISGSIENKVGFYGILKIMINIGVEPPAQLRIGGSWKRSPRHSTLQRLDYFRLLSLTAVAGSAWIWPVALEAV